MIWAHQVILCQVRRPGMVSVLLLSSLQCLLAHCFSSVLPGSERSLSLVTGWLGHFPGQSSGPGAFSLIFMFGISTFLSSMVLRCPCGPHIHK